MRAALRLTHRNHNRRRPRAAGREDVCIQRTRPPTERERLPAAFVLSDGVLDCARQDEYSRAVWRTSSWCNAYGTCVEVAHLAGGDVGVRDSKVLPRSADVAMVAGEPGYGCRGGEMPARILTSHAGSLPRPENLIGLNHQRASGELADEDGYRRELAAAVADVVARQRDAGIDLVNDGEYGHSMGQRYDYGSWWTYAFQRLGGLELVPAELHQLKQARPKPGDVVLASFAERRDWQLFSEAYGDPGSGAALPRRAGGAAPVCRGPIKYQGHEAVRRDIADLRPALDAAGLTDGFLNSVAPGSCARFGNEYYDNDTELLYACAEAMREEYRAIIDAGLILQLDDPAIAENWDQINPAPSVADYKRFTMARVEALNHAIRGLPAERIRFHLCWAAGTARILPTYRWPTSSMSCSR
ncbi:MAG TPA: DUF397 domain-containing protein [Streptosporangiaceae bacterium]|nr:DUF397 domain-containing protein [Streptosporangiaceae bacterium]